MANPPSIAQSPTWTGLGTDDLVEDLDEPPELRSKNANQNFRRTTIRQPSDHQSSLLTKAILGQSDDETNYVAHRDDRRVSMASNISVTSTADLTSDTGLTSPARTNTPSPPLPEMALLRLGNAPEPAPRKRCIQFACNAKPTTVAPPPAAVPMAKAPSAQEAPRRPCIKFACPARPASTQNTPPASQAPTSQPALDLTPQARPRPAIAMPEPISPRQANFRRIQGRGSAPRPKFLRASSVDLSCDGSQFHEFARGMAREDDWIRQDTSIPRTKLTIDDTLVKENRIRRLAKEAEEEAALEEEADDDEVDDEDDAMDDDDEDDDDEDEYDDDEDDEDEDDEDAADGYSSDEETGFADSDEEEDDDENMILWTPVQYRITATTSPLSSKIRRPSLHEQHSDSSTSTGSARVRARRERSRIAIPDDTPDLPDSTDFVCGTLDEDRPLEEAYLSCLAARRNEKLRVIPQDIDPSFPASDPEDEEEEELYNPVHHSSDDEEMWMQGKMEDIDHGEGGRTRRKKRGDGASPKRYHSPPPKARCRSPKPLFERGSPRRVRSPAPNKAMTTPAGSPRQGTNVKFQLAGRPGLMHTKSLPRPGAFFTMKHGRYPKHHHITDGHVRGAIDIVKGLEKKRQRRKEKFHQKYCDRARRGQIPERKPLPGRGAERMKELGLLMAGKKDQGNYVLSI